MITPFFSIVIPTKNRPHLLGDSIRSVLWQDFDDYEVIVSDNFNDERTKKVVEEFSANLHLRYIRTDKELNMPDHWEFATKYATGKYILILADRSLLRNNALNELHKIIIDNPEDIQVYSWQHITYEKAMKITRPKSKITNKIEIIPSKQLLFEFGQNLRGDYRYPVGVNSCYRRDIGEFIRGKYGRLFWPVAPDVFSSTLLLCHTDRITCIGKPLFIGQQVSESNGEMVNLYGPYIYFDTIDRSYWYRNVPIHAPLVENFAFDDYLAALSMAGKDFSNVDWTNYFLSCYGDLVYRAIVFKWWREHKEEMLQEWERALRTFDKDIQRKVRKKMLAVKIRFSLKAYLANSPFIPILRKLQNRFIYDYHTKRYNTALEAAGFEAT